MLGILTNSGEKILLQDYQNQAFFTAKCPSLSFDRDWSVLEGSSKTVPQHSFQGEHS